jgi:carotenoid cleavage dioxygenase-like enzyme
MTSTEAFIANADRSPARTDNPYLEGNFAPVDRESTLFDLAVEGELPKDLNGLLLRNGPNPVGPIGAGHHWFVGDAMLHAIELSQGRARSYRNRWVRTAHVNETLGLPAAPTSPYQPPIQGSGNVNVIGHAGHVLALSEAGLPYELDRELSTLRQYDFDGGLRSAMTAHPKIDPVSGELLFFGYDFGPVHLRYHRATADGALAQTVEISTPRPTMMHDFGVTQTRIVFMDLPVVFDLELVAQGYRMPFRWNDQHQARIGVMPRDGGDADVRWIEIEPCYVYHPLNAYDDGERIVMDVVRHERTFDLSRTGPEHDSVPVLVRWEIDPGKGTLQSRVLDDRGQEFPRVDPRRESLPHRYGYAVEAGLDQHGGLTFGNLLKHDVSRGTTEVHEVGKGRAASEGVFVPSGKGEDDGYVLAPVYDAARRASDVLVLDARNFSKKPLAIVHLPVRIPFGFHGNFLALAP